MKIVTLILDGHNRLQLHATCSPDLVRREYSVATGRAELIWCGVPPAGTAAKTIVARLQAHFGERSNGGLKTDPDKVMHALTKVMINNPRWQKRWRPFLRTWRKLCWSILDSAVVLQQLAKFRGTDQQHTEPNV